MKFYLSSDKLGNKSKRIRELIPNSNKRMGYIPNALDFSGADSKKRQESIEKDVAQLRDLGLEIELLDLHNYFGKEDELGKKVDQLGGVWVRGGNAFVLRQAMRLSGFDIILKKLTKKNDFLYGGYSAGICVLAPTLKGIDLMDDLNVKAYGKKIEIIWEGLGIIDYSIVPHYKSDHPESEGANKVVKYMRDNKIPFKTLRDGEVIIIG